MKQFLIVLSILSVLSGVFNAFTDAIEITERPIIHAAAVCTVQAGLVAAYNFNQGVGSTLTDVSGNNNHGAILGSRWSSRGKFGSALYFDGRDDRVTVPDSDSLDLDSAMTLEAWVYPSSNDDWDTVIIKEQPASNLSYGLYANTGTSQPRGYIYTDHEIGVRGTSTLPLMAWTHLAVTFDGNLLTLYVNGSAVSERHAPGTILTTSGPLRLGGNAIWGEYFAGRIDDVRIYNWALDEAAIRQDMNEEVCTPPSPTATPLITNTPSPQPTNTATPPPTSIPTRVPTNTAVPPTSTPSSQPTNTAVPPTSTPSPRPTATATPRPTDVPGVDVLESFETQPSSWRVFQDISSTNSSITQVTTRAADGSASAKLAVSSNTGSARIRVNFSDPATSHTWQERPGTWYWQRTSIYLPSATVAQLGASDYVTIAGLWPSSGGSFGWYLRVRQGGQLYVFGYTADGKPVELNIYGTFPQDRWVELELGLHSQAGPGVKRAFAVVIDGEFYGWYRQGHMQTETYDRAAVGILSTTKNGPLEVFVDRWYRSTNARFPSGPDKRSTAQVQEQNFRSQSGIQVQYDWSTWEYEPTLHQLYGLYSPENRLQAGRNIDRMPNLSNGWAEIEIDWPYGTPPTKPSSWFGPMVGFRKEINREQNLEIIPVGVGDGNVNLIFQAWIDGPTVLAQWALPMASIGGTHLPEPGDIIRVRWEEISASKLNVRASYYDASARRWYTDVISGTYDISNLQGVNFSDGYHTASSITIDSRWFSIRRYKVGTLATYP